MMHVESFLKQLHSKNIKLHVQNGKLKIFVPKEAELGCNDKQFLKENKNEILKYLYNFYRPGNEVKSIYALSPLQEGMLFHSLHSNIADQYATQISWEYHGNLNSKRLYDSWKRIIERHDIFRAKILWKNVFQPVQVVQKNMPLQWQQYDWRSLSEDDIEGRLNNLLKEDRERGFDFENGLLTRFYLICVDHARHIFIWSHHHILIDGWCLGVIFNELSHFYNDGAGDLAYVKSNAYSYGKYIEWISRQNKDIARRFWKGRFDRISVANDLVMSDKSIGPHKPINKLGKYLYYIPKDSSTNYERFVKNSHITLNVLFQFAWAVLLSKYNSSNQIVYGSVVSGRPEDLLNADKIVGLFINTIPVSIVLDKQKSINEQLMSFQNFLQEATQHSYLSLSEIQKLSGMPSEMPLFNNLLVFENYPVDEEVSNFSSEVQIKFDGMHSYEKTNYPLVVVVAPGEKMLIKVLYDEDIFSEKNIQGLVANLQNILNWMIDHANCVIDQFGLLVSKEEKIQLDLWNKNESAYPRDKSLLKVFAESAEKNANEVALIYKDHELSYKELDERSNKLSRLLVKRSEGDLKGKLIGLCVERGIEMVVGILGILKAGGAYVPLDPEYPEERLRYMISDTDIKLLVTDKNTFSNPDKTNLQKLFADELQNIVILDGEEEREELESLPSSSLEIKVNPKDLVYVIYTSGSTGNPKGVLVEHHNIVRLVKGQNYIKFAKGDRIAQSSTILFDASTLELWGSLLNGLGMVILDREVLLSPESLKEELKAKRITMMWLTSSLFNQMISEDTELFEGLNYLLIGGEALDVESIGKLLREEKRPKHILNGYGPTENTTFTTTYDISELATQEELEALKSKRSIPIGKPISNTEVYVLDEEKRLLPIGVVGELYAGGEGLSRGYLNREDLTKERFIENPLLSEEEKAERKKQGLDTRLYKTGDLVRWLEDGNLEFIGRVDDQIKLRGYRIELGEIEEALKRHESIKEAVVLLKQDKLVAYYVEESKEESKEELQKESKEEPQEGSEEPSIDILKSYLSTKLPDYMLPSIYIRLEELPLNANGKLNLTPLNRTQICYNLRDNKEVFICQKIKSKGELGVIVQNLNKRQLS